MGLNVTDWLLLWCWFVYLGIDKVGRLIWLRKVMGRLGSEDRWRLLCRKLGRAVLMGHGRPLQGCVVMLDSSLLVLFLDLGGELGGYAR